MTTVLYAQPVIVVEQPVMVVEEVPAGVVMKADAVPSVKPMTVPTKKASQAKKGTVSFLAMATMPQRRRHKMRGTAPALIQERAHKAIRRPFVSRYLMQLFQQQRA